MNERGNIGPYSSEEAGQLPESSDISGSPSDSQNTRKNSQFRENLEERLSRHGSRPISSGVSSSSRRSRLQKQLDPSEPPRRYSVDASEKGSITPSMRKRYLKELFLTNRSGLSSILSETESKEVEEGTDDGDEFWALDPLEHAWMLSVVDGNYETMVEFLAKDPSLLSRKDFISGFTALHWLAKNGRDETLLQIVKHAEKEGVPVNVNLRGSGGLTPLHLAAMHNQNMVVKVLIGALGANVDVMDYNGKRAWQYLRNTAASEMKELLGAWDDEHSFVHLNMNNSAIPAQQIEERQENPKTEKPVTRQRFTSVKRFLYNVGLLEKV